MFSSLLIFVEKMQNVTKIRNCLRLQIVWAQPTEMLTDQLHLFKQLGNMRLVL